jgi:hypothetical protein
VRCSSTVRGHGRPQFGPDPDRSRARRRRPGISRAPRGGFGRDFEAQRTWSSEVSKTSSAETDHWQATLTFKLSFLSCPKHGRDVRTARPDCMRNDPSAHTIDHSEAEIWGSAPWERVAHLPTKCTST